MIGDTQVVAIVPARGGSKGIPRKNLSLLGGQTLLERAIAVGLAVGGIDRAIVSTDDQEIATVAAGAGADVHHRPPELATDTSRVIESIRHLCDTVLDPAGAGNAALLLLEPTCPLRAVEDVNACLQALLAGEGDCVATFTPAHTNPWRAWRLEAGRPEHFVPGANPWLPRQKLPPAFELSGSVYAFWRDSLRDPENEILSGRIHAITVPPERSVDIDTAVDLAVCEILLQREPRS